MSRDKFRWMLYGLVTRSRRVCPANAHGAIIWRTQPLRGILVDSTCRRDCAANGFCWCGNLRTAKPEDSSLLTAKEADQ